jgi:hypothetical protein
MRAAEFEKNQLNEIINPAIRIGSWFSQKYKRQLNSKLGANKIKKFTNQHIAVFMQFMAMQRANWPTLTMYVVYRYIVTKMKLKNDDVVSVVNEVLRDAKSGSKITNLSLGQIQDTNKQLKLADITKNRASNSVQTLSEMIIAAASVRQLERHWEEEENVGDEEKINNNNNIDSQTNNSNINGISKDDIEKAINLLKQSDGKLAALEYLERLAGEYTISGKNTNNKITASDGKTYQSTTGKNGDVIWHNINDNADEADDDITNELNSKQSNLQESIKKLRKILETASGGSTSSGSIASIANPMGATISRTPNLFGYIPYTKPKTKKRKNKRKNT